MPAAKPDSGAVKVMVSMTADDVRRIDARANAAHMSRSAFVVEMTLREDVSLVSAVETLQAELRRFAADNAGWKSEVATIHRQSAKREKAISSTLLLANETLAAVEKRNKAGVPASSAVVTKALKAIIQALGALGERGVSQP